MSDPKTIIIDTKPAQPQKRPAAPLFGPAPPAKCQADLNSHVFRTLMSTKDDMDKRLLSFPLIVVGHPPVQCHGVV